MPEAYFPSQAPFIDPPRPQNSPPAGHDGFFKRFYRQSLTWAVSTPSAQLCRNGPGQATVFLLKHWLLAM